MGLTIDQDSTVFTGMDSSGKKTLKRTMIFNNPERLNQAEASNDVLIPTIHQCHPDDALYVVDSISEMEYFDEPPQYKIEVSYILNTETVNNGGSQFSRGKRPWDLGPQNFQKTSNTEKMLHEVEEMMMMCAVKKHLPEGMVSQIRDKAVHYYADNFGVK